MSAFPIEKGIPMPARAQADFPFADMEPGDSFLLPIPAGARCETVRLGMYRVASGLGYVVSTKREGQAFRVWLVGRSCEVAN